MFKAGSQEVVPCPPDPLWTFALETQPLYQEEGRTAQNLITVLADGHCLPLMWEAER